MVNLQMILQVVGGSQVFLGLPSTVKHAITPSSPLYELSIQVRLKVNHCRFSCWIPVEIFVKSFVLLLLAIEKPPNRRFDLLSHHREANKPNRNLLVKVIPIWWAMAQLSARGRYDFSFSR